MKWVLVVVAGAVLLGLAAFIIMAFQSHRHPGGPGLQQGQLRPCPDSPNCVCSETGFRGDSQHAINALNADAVLWHSIDGIIHNMGGDIQSRDGDYMHVTFSTPVLHYVDDVELRFDRVASLIQIRSASRVGRSDFGVNRKRVENIRQALARASAPN